MSDFDKEKEREKLREKYERDEEKRETAEQMSELLLQGATMTNAHCSECGSPIFRYDGQEFCPTCEKPVTRDGSHADSDEEDNDDSTEQENIEVTSPSDEARVAFGGESTTGESSTEVDAPQSTPQSASDTSEGQTVPEPTDSDPREHTAETSQSVPGIDPSGETDLASARESLVRTLNRFSQQAAATSEPQRATEYLTAAREAAEALAALRQ